MKLIFTLYSSLIINILANSQSYNIPATPTLKYLYKSKSEISKIGNTEKLFLFPIKIAKKQGKFKLIKNFSGLFALVDGTGQVYKATKLQDDFVTFTRIDSTNFFGNTFASINFSHKDIIYSFGGYGFWHLNGQLSHFIPGGEWAIDKINTTYNTINDFYSYQLSELKLYYLEYPRVDESTFRITDGNNIIAFDIEKKENIVLGKLNPKIKNNWEYFVIDLPSLHGTISYNVRDIYLYVFSKNKVYKLLNTKIKDALTSKAEYELETTFEDSGKLYYSFNNDTTLRCLQISMNDFEEENYPIYIPEKKYTYLWIALIVIIIIVSILGLYKFNNRKKTTKEDFVEEVYTVDLNSNEFNAIETSLINMLIEKSNIDSHLTVDELNSILGIKKKTIEIQKRVRTEAINRINHKFNVNFNLETVFIERTRSADDRRYFNYIISKANAKIYLKKATI